MAIINMQMQTSVAERLADTPMQEVQVAGVVTKGNGECFLMTETHAVLTEGGGQAGQGYPCVLTAGFCGNASSEARGIGLQTECSPTIKTGQAPSVLCLNDQGGSQMHTSEDVSGTLRAQEHGHQPLIMATQQGRDWRGDLPDDYRSGWLQRK